MTTTSNHLPPQWKLRVQAMVNAHGWDKGQWSHENDRLLEAWARAEGSLSTAPKADWNPLNTTERYKGSTNFNITNPETGAGVQNYTKPIYGIIATVATLLNGNYGGILGAIQGGIDGTLVAEEIVEKNRAQFQTWGTNPDVILGVLRTLP